MDNRGFNRDLLINKTMMKSDTMIFRLLPLLALLQAGLYSCDTIREDLPPCPRHLQFSYTYNMKYADAFAHEMASQPKDCHAELYVYDEAGKFLSSVSFDPAQPEAARIPIDLPSGTYRLMAWCGLNDTDYTWSTPQTGDPLADWKIAVNKEPDATVSRELAGLFQGQMSLTIPTDSEDDIVFPLVKNTNKIRLVLIDTNSGTTPIDADAFAVEATTTNSDLDYRNQPLADTTILWKPYYQGTGRVNDTDGQQLYTAAVYELNTLRLLEGTPTSLRITHKSEAAPFLDVDLTGFLLLTRMESHNIGAQEYLDRQDEYTVLVYLDMTGGKAHYLQIIVNDWTIRLDDANLGKKEG